MLDQPVGQLNELVKVDGAILVGIILCEKILETAGIDLVADSVEECVQLTAVDGLIRVAVKGVEALPEVLNLLLGQFGGLK